MFVGVVVGLILMVFFGVCTLGSGVGSSGNGVGDGNSSARCRIWAILIRVSRVRSPASSVGVVGEDVKMVIILVAA